MNYSLIRACDIANGPGVRVSLFVSGCTHHCPGCFQPETWNFNAGQPFIWKHSTGYLSCFSRTTSKVSQSLAGNLLNRAINVTSCRLWKL